MLDDVRERQEHAAEAWLLLRRGLVPGEGACTVHMCLIRYEALSSEVVICQQWEALFVGYRYSPARGTRDDYTHAR